MNFQLLLIVRISHYHSNFVLYEIDWENPTSAAPPPYVMKEFRFAQLHGFPSRFFTFVEHNENIIGLWIPKKVHVCVLP